MPPRSQRAPGSWVFCGGCINVGGARGRCWNRREITQDGRGSTSQRDERNSHRVEAGEVGLGCQSRIKDQMLGKAPMRLLPELDEAKDLVGLLALPQVRV